MSSNKDDARRDGIDQGRTIHQNAGLGQERVGEAGPGPEQTALPPTGGGPGTGSGDDRTATRDASEDDNR